MKKIFFLIAVLAQFEVYGQALKVDTVKVRQLENVSIIGERMKKPIGGGQFISKKKLEKFNQSNVNNVLRMIPGVNVRDEEGFGLRPNIGLRGTAVNRSSKITLMEDGILIAPAPYADPSAYYFPTFSRMQGVEVLKGSSQIKHGPYTIGGAVNLISTSIPDSLKGFAQVAYGSFNTNQQRIWLGNKAKNISYVFELNRLASDGFKELENGSNTGFDRRDVMAKIRWQSDESSKVKQYLTLKLLSTTEDSNETYLGLTYNDYQLNPLKRYAVTQKDYLDMKHTHLSLSHHIAPIAGLQINTVAYYSDTYRD
ncbi:MAG: TonB-dependent receptor plug domain-containing protein, partial [Sphingobacteriaceae bacterium]|nr:TonB-dependent receptor plug domain-containing protein [Sphingobacteriaceae bacterium]